MTTNLANGKRANLRRYPRFNLMRSIFGLSWLLAPVLFSSVASGADCPVVFQPKVFTDVGNFVSVKGTLTGAGVPYKYNLHRLVCDQEKRECLVTMVDSIGPADAGICQVYVDMPMPLTVVQWTPDRIIAAFDNECGGNIYTIDRRAETVASLTRSWVNKVGIKRSTG